MSQSKEGFSYSPTDQEQIILLTHTKTKQALQLPQQPPLARWDTTGQADLISDAAIAAPCRSQVHPRHRKQDYFPRPLHALHSARWLRSVWMNKSGRFALRSKWAKASPATEQYPTHSDWEDTRRHRLQDPVGWAAPGSVAFLVSLCVGFLICKSGTVMAPSTGCCGRRVKTHRPLRSVTLLRRKPVCAYCSRAEPLTWLLSPASPSRTYTLDSQEL